MKSGSSNVLSANLAGIRSPGGSKKSRFGSSRDHVTVVRETFQTVSKRLSDKSGQGPHWPPKSGQNGATQAPFARSESHQPERSRALQRFFRQSQKESSPKFATGLSLVTAFVTFRRR
jgi:hypothetical protein